jgi:hypothetical protein
VKRFGCALVLAGCVHQFARHVTISPATVISRVACLNDDFGSGLKWTNSIRCRRA